MIPSPFVFAVLALAALRMYRLLALDTFPPLARARDRLVGVRYEQAVAEFRRPLLAEWLTCAWCSGLAYAAGIYLLWLWQPDATLACSVPLALSAAVGILQSFLPT